MSYSYILPSSVIGDIRDWINKQDFGDLIQYLDSYNSSSKYGDKFYILDLDTLKAKVSDSLDDYLVLEDGNYVVNMTYVQYKKGGVHVLRSKEIDAKKSLVDIKPYTSFDFKLTLIPAHLGKEYPSINMDSKQICFGSMSDFKISTKFSNMYRLSSMSIEHKDICYLFTFNNVGCYINGSLCIGNPHLTDVELTWGICWMEEINGSLILYLYEDWESTDGWASVEVVTLVSRIVINKWGMWLSSFDYRVVNDYTNNGIVDGFSVKRYAPPIALGTLARIRLAGGLDNMSILATYQLMKSENKLYTLVYNGSIVGIRACIYNYEDKKYTYYDFDKSIIKNSDIQKMINTHKSKFQPLPLRKHNGLLMTEQEISQGVVVQEFSSPEVATNILSVFLEVYK